MISDKYPDVSVIVNTHPGAHGFLPRALASIAAQDFGGTFEVILICDGPIDEPMADILTEWVPRLEERAVRVLTPALEEPYGSQAGPKNWATYLAKGDYIAYLDGDNAWTPDHLSRLYEAVREGEVWPDFTYGRRRYIRDEGAPEKVGDTPLSEGDSPLIPWGEEAVARLGSGPMNNFIDTSDFLISRGALWWKAVEHGWMWNEKYRRFGDWVLMAEGCLLLGWRGKAVDKILSEYHWTASNISHSRPATEGVGMESLR